MGLFIFRCDASLRIGSGHIMRCLTLARALNRRGCESVFLCRPHAGNLATLLAKEFRVLWLRDSKDSLLCESHSDSESVSGRRLYADWLGCTEEEDAKECLAALADANIEYSSWLVLDHYALAAPWQRCMQEGLRLGGGSVPAVLVLDDLADRAHQASVLMDANRLDPSAPDPYRDRVPEACTTLLGPAFA